MVSVTLSGLAARYGRKAIFSDVTTPALHGGRLTALIGANAAGKSTLFRRIAGQLDGAGTTVIHGAAPHDLRYMPQETNTSAALTVYEAVVLALKQDKRSWRLDPAELAAVDDALKSLKIEDLAFRQLTELSGGQRQLVSIAQTLVCQPRVVLMDEPTSALDLYRQFEVLELLRDYARSTGAVVILALHDLNQVLRYCQTTLAIAGGRMEAVGETTEVVNSDLVRRLYGVEARFEACSRGHPIMIVDGQARG